MNNKYLVEALKSADWSGNIGNKLLVQASIERIAELEAELAKLKGDAVPVGEMVSVLRGLQRQSEVAWRGGLVPVKGTRLFTHAQPVPVVVLPHVQREFVNQLRAISTTYGKTQQLRAHLSNAVDKFVSGITVKSTNGEG